MIGTGLEQQLVIGRGETLKLDIEDTSKVTLETVGGSKIEFIATPSTNPTISVGDDIAQLDVSVEEFLVTSKKLLDYDLSVKP